MSASAVRPADGTLHGRNLLGGNLAPARALAFASLVLVVLLTVALGWLNSVDNSSWTGVGSQLVITLPFLVVGGGAAAMWHYRQYATVLVQRVARGQ